jgi:hypothetical protein
MNVRCFYLNKLLVLFIFTICFSISSSAQETRSQFWQQVRFGGGIGLSFGDGFFSGTLAPSAIYEFNDQLAFGVGLNGSYNTLKNNYKSTIIGGSVLSLFNVIRELQISSEFELLNVNRNYDSRLALADDNYWYPALFLGGGFRSNNVTFGIRFDVLYDIDRSIYANAWAPFVRVYF